jgi:hypothetical protein
MKLFLTIALVLLSALVVLCDNSNKLPPTSLQIGVKFMPEECLGKAKNGYLLDSTWELSYNF